jgi:uncharacterized membrane protein YgaE (UPF0421/DUF939 family)
LQLPFFAGIAAVFTIESRKATPIYAGIMRMLGSLAGASVGIVFAFIRPGNAILCGLGMVVIIFICNIFNWDNTIPIAGVIFLAIMLGTNMKNPLQYSINRILSTFTGIAVAVIVDYLIPSGGKTEESSR